MRHFPAILIKFLIIGLILAAALPMLARVAAAQVVTLAVTVTLPVYILGDLGVLPNLGNLAATIADAIIAFITIWIAPFVARTMRVSLREAASIAVIIATGEYLFHIWLQRADLVQTKQP